MDDNTGMSRGLVLSIVAGLNVFTVVVTVLVFPAYVSVPLTILLQIMFSAMFYNLCLMPRKVKMLDVLYAAADGHNIMMYVFGILLRRLDVFVPSLVVWYTGAYVIPRLPAVPDVYHFVDREVLMRIATVSEIVSRIIPYVILIFFVLMVIWHIYTYFVTDPYRIKTYVLDKLERIGIRARFVHRDGRLLVDWDDILDKLHVSDAPEAREYYTYIVASYKYLKGVDFGPFGRYKNFFDYIRREYAKEDGEKE